MRKEEKFNPALSSFFDEANSPDDSSLTDLVRSAKNRYENFLELAEGGLKKIQICEDKRTGRKVVMATLLQNDNPAHTEKFLREARLNAALQHPNIVPVYDVGIKDEEPWFTMKYLEGKTLGDIIFSLKEGAKSHFSDLNERLDLFIKVCDAISYAHSRGILHMDLKPENIQISNFGDVSVCDWGLADVVASDCDEALLDLCTLTSIDLNERTVDGVVKGSPGFMAPEQTTLTEFRKGKHSDIFSLGALLYSILTFQKPFKGKNFKEIVLNTASCNFQKPSERSPDLNIPYSLEAVCLKAMQLNPEDRYSSVEELKKEIMDFRNGYATEAENASTLKALKLLVLRNRALSALALIVFAAVIVVTSIAVKNLNLERVNALQEAEKNKLEAERSRIEKEYHERLNIEAAPRFYEAAKIAYNTYRFDDALKFCNTVVELDKSNKDTWELKGVLHFARLEFKEAVNALSLSEKNNKLIQIAQKFSKKKNDNKRFYTAEVLELMKETINSGFYREFTDIMHVKISSDMRIEERIAFCKTVLLYHNNNQKNHLRFSYDKETQHLDVSGNPWLRVAFCLQNFPAKSANFSGTGISEFIIFSSMPIEELDVSHTKIVVLNSLASTTLKKLKLSYTAVNNVGPLKDSQIEELDISRTQVKNVNSVILIPKLKRLIVHKGQFNDKKLAALPKRIEVKIIE